MKAFDNKIIQHIYIHILKKLNITAILQPKSEKIL